MSVQRVIKIMGLYTLQADEIGVKLRMGRLAGIAQPGPGFAFPILDQVLKTKSSLQTIDLPDQQIVLNGNIAIAISGNLNFRVAEPEKAILQVQDYRYTVQQFAMTTIADVLSTKTIEEVRNAKPAIAQEIEDLVAETASRWGLADVDIRLTDARLDESLMRAMMRETEAEKEARASQIRADSDRAVAQAYAEAAKTLAESPGAMTLRILQTMTDMSNDKSTILLPLPWDMMSGMKSSWPSLDPEILAGRTPSAPRPSVAEPETSELPTGDDDITHCKLEFQAHRTLALCPQCDTKYNVTDVLGDMRYDKRPDVPGLQLQCKRCLAVFTLPGSD